MEETGPWERNVPKVLLRRQAHRKTALAAAYKMELLGDGMGMGWGWGASKQREAYREADATV